MRVLSLGAGVQSSTLLLMAREGELDLDVAVFADTQWEPAAVYAHLDWLESVSTVPIYRVTAGNLRSDALANRTQSWMPVYDDAGNQLKRQCTRNYKIRPIRQQIRALGGGPRHPVDQIIGISLDEWQRVRTSDVAYIRHVYPLIERRMTRTDCLAWIGQHGYPRPPRSHCIGCPFRTDREWRALDGEQWADAVDFDTRIREVFLHRSGQPLITVDLRSQQDRGQLEMFDEECEGVCGV